MAKRPLLLALAFLLAAPLAAQSSLATPFDGTTNTTTVGGVYFDLTVLDPRGVRVLALDLHSGSAAGVAGTVDVYTTPGSYVGQNTDPSAWSLLAAATVTSAGVGAPSTMTFPAPVDLAPGPHAIAVVTTGISQRYTPGTACASATLPGTCANSLFANSDLVLAAGATSTVPFGPAAGSRVWNGAIHYGPRADVRPFGLGGYASFYQHFADAPAAHAALANRSLRLSPSGRGYRAVWGGGGFVPMGLFPAPLFATPSDNAWTTVTPSQPLPTPHGPETDLRINTNGLATWGIASIAIPSGNENLPTAADFVAANAHGLFGWHDFNESEFGSGSIVSEESVVGGHLVLAITWLQVESLPSGVHNQSTMQMQFDLTDGTIAIVWGNVDDDPSSPRGSAWLVGYRDLSASLEPGSIDLATTLPLVTNDWDDAVRIASTDPRLGATWTITLDQLAPTHDFAAIAFGSTRIPLGIDLGMVGQPGCRLYHSLDLGWVLVAPASGSASWSLQLPSSPRLAGSELQLQAAAQRLFFPLTFAISGGLSATVGF